MNDDTALREQLLEAQMRLELGEITDEEFAEIERDVLVRIREIKGAQPGGLTLTSPDGESSASRRILRTISASPSMAPGIHRWPAPAPTSTA